MEIFEQIAEEIASMTAVGLANLAEAEANNDEAVAFYESIRDDYVEAIRYAEGKPDDRADGEIADGAPDVYNATRMAEVYGTGAYLNSSELGTGNETIIELAGFVLYELAAKVVYELAEYYDERAEELADEEELDT